MVCSAAETVLPPGVFITTTPLRVAAGTSMLSTPTPAPGDGPELAGVFEALGGDLGLRADDDRVGGSRGRP